MPRVKTDGKRNKNRLPLPNSIPNGTRTVTVCIPDGDEYFMYLVGGMYRLGQQIWYDRDESKTAKAVAQVWRNALAKTLAGECSPKPNPPLPTGWMEHQTIIMEDMQKMYLEYEARAGKFYAKVPCGDCDNTHRYFELVPASTDPNGNPAPASDKITFPDSVVNVTPAQGTCYQQGATAYMLSRASEFLAKVIEGSSVAIDWLSGANETYTTVQLVDDILFGRDIVPELQTSTVAIMQAALDSVEPAMIASFPTTTDPDRATIKAWTETAPFLAGGFPVRNALGFWLKYSIIVGYGPALSAIRAECVSDYEEPAGDSWTQVGEAEGTTIYAYTETITIPVDGSTPLAQTFGDGVLGVSWVWSPFDGGGLGATIDGQTLTVGSSPQGVNRTSITIDGANKLTALTGEPWPTTLITQSPPTSITTNYAGQLEPYPSQIEVAVTVYTTEAPP